MAVTVEVCPSPAETPSDPGDVEFFVPPFLSTGPVVQMTAKMPALRVIQLLSAGADAWVGRVPAGVTLCDGRGVHNSSTAEWALTAILTHMRTFPAFIRAQAKGHWLSRDEIGLAPELTGKNVLIVGAGAIGEALATRLVACEASVVKVARTARDGVYGIDDLPALLPTADVVVLLLPLTVATTGIVDAAFLARMRDGALLVNAARGPIVVTEALMAEVGSGRLAAALDVTDPEPLPDGHPLWSMPNVIITPHVGGAVAGLLARAYALAHAQLRRYIAGEPLENVVTGDY
ncbi:MAG TPA: 2-hydroxyacid dehydrogenase [Micromonosporaceae bacterium]|nr:2-hydroxyacid dehydrogenase [Micromonosporaceae bacterium]